MEGATHFIEVWRYIPKLNNPNNQSDQIDNKVNISNIYFLDSFLLYTRQTSVLKTICVWKIKLKKQ